jgi:3-phosphoshikimate 1-carboxyvinyltransferase
MLAVVGVRCTKGLMIRGAECVAKSYPDFFDDLERLGVKLVRLPAHG